MGSASLRLKLGALAVVIWACNSQSTITTPSESTADPGTEPVDCDQPGPRDPGTVTLHRLNRAEYDNTVRDLLGDTGRPARAFPADEHRQGFDNNADVLAVAPILVEKYEAAAEALVESAWSKDFAPAQSTRVEAEAVRAAVGAPFEESGWTLDVPGQVAAPVEFLSSGTFTLSVRAFGKPSDGEAPKLRFKLDGKPFEPVEVKGDRYFPEVYQLQAEVSSGMHLLAVEFVNAQLAQTDQDAGKLGRSLTVDWLQVERAEAAVPQDQALLRTCDPAQEGCARDILSRFGRRAFRRPLAEDELQRLLALVLVGETPDAGVKLALRAILLSPHFLFRVEVDPDPSSTEPHPLSDHELAARLSYFLWSSTPDEELLAAADSGALQDPAVLEAQVRRMLDDPKSEALVHNFGGQWLFTRAVESLERDPQAYPELDEALKAAMQGETELLLTAFLREDRNFLDLLDADFTFLNDRLAQHYGLPPLGSDELTRVPASSERRRGVLSHASLLSVTSHADRTSPVKRGFFILAQLLCREPPPPPADVPDLEPQALSGTLREQMEAHRAKPACAGCHAVMDPMGFALENYDLLGRWRDQDQGVTIDPSGTLPDGRAFSGPSELRALLRSEPGLSECVTQQLYVYALGRVTTREDRCVVKDLAGRFNARGNRLPELILELVRSEPFRMRRGEGKEAGR